jgi:poly-gamma-glutamate capsule biosynthesis protein CapA/YwtB (metallophosphatase superfamily)
MWVRRIGAFIIAGGILATGVLWAEAPTDTYIPMRHTDQTITIGWVGDMVPSDDAMYNQTVFDAVANELQKPDLMIGNLEGTFAQPDRLDKCLYLMSMCHAFRGDASFAASIKAAGFDFVSLVNNHSYDFGEDGLRDTQTILDETGIPYISPTKQSTSIVVKGRKIGILGLSSTEPTKTITDYGFIKREVTQLKEKNDFVIVIFHGGAEGSDKTVVPNTTEYMGTENRGDVAQVARVAVDAGADLVLGSGPHVLRKIEPHNGAVVAYSLGNFVGGKHLLTTGILGVSGIFTATLEKDTPTTYDFTSVALSKDGTPSLDPTDNAKALITSLPQ